MDPKKKLRLLQQQKSALLAAAGEILSKETVTDEDLATVKAKQDEAGKLNAQIEALEAHIAMLAETQPVETIEPDEPVQAGGNAQVKKMPFSGFGEQLQAIKNAYASKMKEVDPRLFEVEKMAAAAGGAAAVGSDGGFLIQSDFQQDIMRRAYDVGQILPKCRRARLTSNSDKLVIPYVDETTRATGSRWGGIQVYWANEADVVTAKKPKIGKLEVPLNKLIGLAYMTRELLEDAGAMDDIYKMAFSEEIAFMLENAIFVGSGAGQPLGFLNSPALVSVGKETGQEARTILYENILNMYARCWSRSLLNAEFTINQDIIPQLGQLNTLIGVGGNAVFLPPGNSAANAPHGTLLGRPIVPTEYNKTLGTQGDIGLIDFSQYLVLDKGELRVDMSEHVNFTSDEIAMRFVLRVGGQPLWHSAVTPLNGTQTKSPYVVLDTRA